MEDYKMEKNIGTNIAKYVVDIRGRKNLPCVEEKIRNYAERHKRNLLPQNIDRKNSIERHIALISSGESSYDYNFRDKREEIYGHKKKIVELIIERDNELDFFKNTIFGKDYHFPLKYIWSNGVDRRTNPILTQETIAKEREKIIENYDPRILAIARKIKTIEDEQERILQISFRYFDGGKRKTLTRQEYADLRRQARIDLRKARGN